MIKIFGTPKSRAFRCYWTLEELKHHINLPYEISLETSPHPLGKIPLLEDTEKKIQIFESLAICSYLADLDPKKTLFGGDDIVQRSWVLQWLSFVVTELEQPLWSMAKNTFVFPKESRLEGEALSKLEEQCRGEFQRCMKVLSSQLQGKDFLVNNSFSLADIFVGHTLFWAKMADFNYLDETMKNYYKRLRERESVRHLLAQ